MNRTIGVRLGPKNFVTFVMNKLEQNKRYNKDTTHQTKYLMAMHQCINIFFKQDLKMEKKEYEKIKIGHIIESDQIDCDLIYIVFKTIEDVSKVNSKFKNLNEGNRNKISQYVPKELKARFKAFESIAYNIRQEKGNTVTTKIRASKNYLILLVRDKNVKCSWNSIEPTRIPLETSKNAIFEFGKLSNEDFEKEGEQMEKSVQRFERHNEKRNNYENLYISTLDFPENSEYFDKIYAGNIDLNVINEEDTFNPHNSTEMEEASMDTESKIT